jgi:hypothetical protein
LFRTAALVRANKAAVIRLAERLVDVGEVSGQVVDAILLDAA